MGSYDITCVDKVMDGLAKDGRWEEEMEFALSGLASVGQHHLGWCVPQLRELVPDCWNEIRSVLKRMLDVGCGG